MTHLNATEGTKKLRSIIDGRLFLQGSIFAFDDATFENSKKKRSEELVVQKKSLRRRHGKSNRRVFNNKIIFAVNAPNEEELDPILKEEVGKKSENQLK